MKKKSTSYHALAQIAAFSVGAESDAQSLSIEEIDASLMAQDVDLMQLEQATLRRVNRLRNEMNASKVGEQLRRNFRPRLTIVEMRRALEEEGQLLAAKAKETLADEDIEAIYRLTHPDEPTDGA